MWVAGSSMLANVWRGVRMGVSVAIGFSIIAAVLTVAFRENAFESIHASFLGGIAMYLVAGFCLGAVGGALTPLMGSNIGLALVGMLLGWLANFVIQIAENGLGVWQHYDWFTAVGFAVVGIPIAFYTRRSIRARAQAKAPDSKR
jgi:hypothetical protein